MPQPNGTAPSLPEKMVDFVVVATTMAEKAASYEQAQAAMEKEADALIPGIVDILAATQIDDGDGQSVPLLQPNEKSACLDALKDPVKALNILTKVATHLKAANADRIGHAVSRDKQANAKGLSPYAGRRSSAQSPAWERFQTQIMGG